MKWPNLQNEKNVMAVKYFSLMENKILSLVDSLENRKIIFGQ